MYPKVFTQFSFWATVSLFSIFVKCYEKQSYMNFCLCKPTSRKNQFLAVKRLDQRICIFLRILTSSVVNHSPKRIFWFALLYLCRLRSSISLNPHQKLSLLYLWQFDNLTHCSFYLNVWLLIKKKLILIFLILIYISSFVVKWSHCLYRIVFWSIQLSLPLLYLLRIFSVEI